MTISPADSAKRDADNKEDSGGAAVIDDGTLPFDDIGEVGIVPWFLPVESKLVPMVRIDIRSGQGKSRTVLSTTLIDVAFLAKTLSEAVEQSLTLCKQLSDGASHLIDTDHAEALTSEFNETLLAIQRARELVGLPA